MSDYECRFFWENKPPCKQQGGIKSFMILTERMPMCDVNLLVQVADIMTEKKGDKVFFEGLSYGRNVDKQNP